MRKQQGALSDVVEELKRATPHGEADKVSVGDLLDALDERGYGPALTVLPLLELTPIGGIPCFPTLLALTIAIITVRLFMGYEHFWAPVWIRRRQLKSRHVMKSLDWLKPVTLRIDGQLHERLRPLAGRTGQRAACVVILATCATVPPLEIVPFATSGPMIVISIFGLAILFRDGLVMLAGLAAAAIAAGAVLWYLLGASGGSGGAG